MDDQSTHPPRDHASDESSGGSGGTTGAAGRRPGVLFDVDGTLVDTNYLHTLAWSRAIRDAGEWAPMNAIHRCVGMGGDQLLDHLFGRPVPAASEARPARFHELIDEARAFPRALDLLHRVRDLGLVVVLASSAPRDELESMMEVIGVGDVLDAVTSSDDVDEAKPAPDVFRAVLDAGGVDPERAVVVGDSIWDVQAARAAGLACIGVETGGFSAHELREEGAVAVHRDVEELLSQLRIGPIATLVD